VIYQAGTREPSPFNAAGTLEGWREAVAARCVGNSRLILSVCCAFAAPLLELVGEEGGGIHLRGKSQAGKTTALRVAASVWGGTPGAGAGGYICQWRATGNAIEGVACSHSDALLPLDEPGVVDGREVGDVTYMLANGQGKARADRGGGLRAPVRFRTLFLSTGEVSLADKIAEAGRHVKAGQEVRLVDVPSDADAGMGLFEDCHDAGSPNAFAQELKAATASFYDTAAPAFLRCLVERAEREAELSTELRAWVDTLVRDWLALHVEAGGQVRSVARRFALTAVAGELATMAGVTGWDQNVATEAAGVCFGAWLGQRGTTGALEDAQVVAQLRTFIGKHGPSRFEEWKERALNEAAQGNPDINAPAERFRTPQRAGWRRWVAEADGRHAWRYFLTADGMAEALAGLDKKAAHRVLIERGHLIPGSGGKTAGVFTPPGHGAKVRLYQVRSSILGADDGDT
jgi:putative DNA primase/helicase